MENIIDWRDNPNVDFNDTVRVGFIYLVIAGKNHPIGVLNLEAAIKVDVNAGGVTRQFWHCPSYPFEFFRDRIVNGWDNWKKTPKLLENNPNGVNKLQPDENSDPLEW